MIQADQRSQCSQKKRVKDTKNITDIFWHRPDTREWLRKNYLETTVHKGAASWEESRTLALEQMRHNRKTRDMEPSWEDSWRLALEQMRHNRKTRDMEPSWEESRTLALGQMRHNLKTREMGSSCETAIPCLHCPPTFRAGSGLSSHLSHCHLETDRPTSWGDNPFRVTLA